MKIRVTLIIFLLTTVFYSLDGYAQGGPDRKRIDELKIEFVTKRLELTPEELKQFIPVYQSYQSDMNNLIRDKRRNSFDKNNRTAPPNVSADDELAYEARILDLKKHYRMEFQKTLPPEKISILFKAEREFREQLIRELHRRRD